MGRLPEFCISSLFSTTSNVMKTKIGTNLVIGNEATVQTGHLLFEDDHTQLTLQNKESLTLLDILRRVLDLVASTTTQISRRKHT